MVVPSGWTATIAEVEKAAAGSVDPQDDIHASAAYRRALENEPGSGRALWGLATAYEGLGKKQESEKNMAEFRRVWRGEDLK